MGDVEGVADLVEAGGLSVFGEEGFDFEVGNVEQVAEGLFVLETIEPAAGGTAFLGDAGLIGGEEGGVEAGGEVFELVGGGAVFFFGGISPVVTRSWIFTHLAKLERSAASRVSAVRSRLPFLVSASWHSTQCFSMKGRKSAEKAGEVRRRAAMNGNRRIKPVLAGPTPGGALLTAVFAVGFGVEEVGRAMWVRQCG